MYIGGWAVDSWNGGLVQAEIHSELSAVMCHVPKEQLVQGRISICLVQPKKGVQFSQSVQESIVFNGLELALSERQTPRFVGNVSSWRWCMELLESRGVRPRQAPGRRRAVIKS